MNRLALVTGAGGFIGSHLVELLVSEGYRVRAMVHYNSQNRWGWLDTIEKKILNEVEVIASDIRDPFAVNSAVHNCSHIFHLAALIAIPYSYSAPSSYVETNVTGTINVLHACLNKGVERLVHTSTSETYGTAQYVPIDENHPLVGQSPYSASKIAADKMAESFYHSFELPVVTVRPFNTFGPRQSARAVIPSMIIQILSGSKSLQLGALSPVRDLTFVKDTVRGFLAAANFSDAIGQTINIGNGKGISIGDLSSLLLEICKSNAVVVCEEKRLRPQKSEVMRLICNNEKAKTILRWSPAYSLKQGLEETIQWIASNLTRYKSDIYNV